MLSGSNTRWLLYVYVAEARSSARSSSSSMRAAAAAATIRRIDRERREKTLYKARHVSLTTTWAWCGALIIHIFARLDFFPRLQRASSLCTHEETLVMLMRKKEDVEENIKYHHTFSHSARPFIAAFLPLLFTDFFFFCMKWRRNAVFFLLSIFEFAILRCWSMRSWNTLEGARRSRKINAHFVWVETSLSHFFKIAICNHWIEIQR